MNCNDDTRNDHLLKILTLGECGVGKTSIILRYVENRFNKNHLITIGLDFKVKTIKVQDKSIKIKIWDTAGQERFKSISCHYYRGTDGIMLVYDIGDRNSFEKVSSWITQIHKETTSEVVCVLIGNKIDLPATERQVTTEEGKALADEFGLDFYETSAFKNQNVNESFNDLIWKILKTKEIRSPRPTILKSNNVHLLEKKIDHSKGVCCKS